MCETSEMLNFPTEPHSQIRLDHILKSDLDPILKQCETIDITSQGANGLVSCFYFFSFFGVHLNIANISPAS